MTDMQVTLLAKADGPLTKRISLGSDGSIRSDGSLCLMSRGNARRFSFDDVAHLADTIAQLKPNQALALGALRADLPARVDVTTKRKLNGAHVPGLIARTATYIGYRPGRPALALIDYDCKGMPADVATRIRELGGVWAALVSVMPQLAKLSRIERKSTSAGLFRTDTGNPLPGSGGQHIYLAVKDGSDIERFLKTLHLRCWLAGLGWLMVGAGGQLLERSIVDRIVGAPERIVFEGAPELDPPLAQDQSARLPAVFPGESLDTVTVCPPLTILEQARLRAMRATEANRLGHDAAKARKTFIGEQAQRLVERTGIAPNRAAQIVAQQCDGILLPDVVLPFDDEDLADATVADVLTDPDRFEDATLADPLEGVEYGAGKAKIMRRPDGSVWIHSFAHGRAAYELRYDYRAARTALEMAPPDDVANAFVRLVLAGDLCEDEIEELRNAVHQQIGITKRTLSQKLKAARKAAKAQHAAEEQERQLAERHDPRPQIPAPPADAPWLPQMEVLNAALETAPDLEPPMRDIGDVVAQVRDRRTPNMHAFTAPGANEEETASSGCRPPSSRS